MPLRIRRLIGGRRTLAVVAVLLAVGGCVALVMGASGRSGPPAPPVAAGRRITSSRTADPPRTASASRRAPATHGPAPAHRARPSLAPRQSGLVMAASTPTELSIPVLGVTSRLLELGLNPDGTAQVPPLSEVGLAGWYRFSAAPGAAGSAVLLGHVDSAASGAGVFYGLGSLTPGDEVDVVRADGSTAVFRVDDVREYAKSSFPTSSVYGSTSYPSLRLVTCGGRFDRSTGNYLDNIVAFASLVASR